MLRAIHETKQLLQQELVKYIIYIYILTNLYGTTGKTYSVGVSDSGFELLLRFRIYLCFRNVILANHIYIQHVFYIDNVIFYSI